MYVFLHLRGRFRERVRVEIRGQVLQIAAAEVVGEGDKSVELVLGQLVEMMRKCVSFGEKGGGGGMTFKGRS